MLLFATVVLTVATCAQGSGIRRKRVVLSTEDEMKSSNCSISLCHIL